MILSYFNNKFNYLKILIQTVISRINGLNYILSLITMSMTTMHAEIISVQSVFNQ